MDNFRDPNTAEKYHRLGFLAADVCLKLKIGAVSITAVGHPFNGVALIFQSVTPRTACQYEVFLPELCSVEQIAGLIYVNIAKNFSGSREMYKAHFEKLGLQLFQ